MIQRLLIAQQQQLPVGANTQSTGAHNQTREALAVRSLISECVQLVKLLRALYQWRSSPVMRSLDQLGQRDTEAQMMTAIRQVFIHLFLLYLTHVVSCHTIPPVVSSGSGSSLKQSTTSARAANSLLQCHSNLLFNNNNNSLISQVCAFKYRR